MAITEQRVRQIQSEEALFAFLREELYWPVAERPATYDFYADELGLTADISGRVGRVRQVANFERHQPWGIFLVEFSGSRVYKNALREVLRGLSESRRNRDSGLPAWQAGNLLFLCTPNFQDFSFARFEGQTHTRATLSIFEWEREESGLRTLCEYNLPALRYPENPLDAEAWLKQWAGAFDVEKVTGRFFEEYERIFNTVKDRMLRDVQGDRRLFTQRLFNRLMFVHFLSKKGWLRFKDRKDYLAALWEGRDQSENFYRVHLLPLFFAGLNNPQARDINKNNAALNPRIGDVPFLNGGLFEEADDEAKGETVDDEAFDLIFNDLFFRFNFTVHESTPENIEVAVDPEMLGKVFEELVTREERQDTGSYYTPRTVVSFMCREALKGYLGGYEALIDEGKATGIDVPKARELLRKLSRVKVVDPACGSGAYLLGMLHELHKLIILLDTRVERLSARDDYQRKLEIVQNNLYGVDKEEFAVNIARLRFWLSLAVEYDGDSPEPLHNLDFKIECGDSLTAPDPQGSPQPDIFRQQQIEEFEEKKAKYADPYALGDKPFLKREIDRIRQEIAEWAHPGRSVPGFDWRVEFAEVFQKGGFDIALANPPYGASVEDDVRNLYFDRRTEGAQSKDTYGLFIARGLQLLRSKGHLCYIVSDTWRTIKSHRSIRKRLLETATVAHVLDLPSWIFNATVNTCILTLTKAAPPEDHTLIAGDLRGIEPGDWKSLEDNLIAVAAEGVDVQTTTYVRYTYIQSFIDTYDGLSFFIGSPKLHKLMSDESFTKLGSIADSPHGISTGNNRRYVRVTPGARGGYDPIEDWMKMSTGEMKRLSDTEKTKGVDKDWTQLTGCFVPFDKGGESDADEGWLPNYYVSTKYYINWAKGAIEDMRQNKGVAWKNEQYFFKPGLTFSISGFYAPTFRLNSESVFEAKGSGIFCDSLDREVLLAFLCSKFARYEFKIYIKHTVDTSGDDIKEFRFPMPDTETAERLKSLVSQIIEHQKAVPHYPYHLYEQREIDAIIYDLYGLNEEDIREIELWYCRRYSKLAEAQGVLEEVKEKYADHLARCARIMEKPPRYWKSHPVLTLIA